MTADLLTNYQHIIKKLELHTGSKGVFDVMVDDQLLFSKKAIGRHAESGEILSRFRDYVGHEVETYPRST